MSTINFNDHYEYKLCEDCVMYLVNSDLSALALLSEDEEDKRREAVMEGVDTLSKQQLLSVEEPTGFSSCNCDTCGDLPGDRHLVYGYDRK